MSIEKITRDIKDAGATLSEERQVRVLQFVKKVKTSRDRTPLFAELGQLCDEDVDTADAAFSQLLHSDLPFMRRFALDFFARNGFEKFIGHVKNAALFETDAENLAMCLEFITGTLDRSELSEFFNFATGGQSQRHLAVLKFLEAECAALNVDFARMRDNAAAMRKQASAKRVEKFEKRGAVDEGVTVAGALGEKLKSEAFRQYLIVAAAAAVIVVIAAWAYSSVRESLVVSGALAAIDEGREKEALAALREFIDDRPDSLQALFHAHRISCENYDVPAANETLGRILALRSSSHLARAAEVRNAMFSGDHKPGTDYFSKEAGKEISLPEIEYLKLHYDYLLARSSKATPAGEFVRIYGELERLAKKRPAGYAPYIAILSLTAAADGGVSEGADELLAAVSRMKSDFKALSAAAYFHEKKGDRQAAAAALAKVCELSPPDEVYEYACRNAGRLLAAAGKHAEAAEYYAKWREARQESVEPLLALMAAYAETRDNSGLNGVFNDAVRKFESDPRVYYNYAMARMRTKEYDEALKYFQKAELLSPDMVEAIYNAGRCLQAQSERFEAHSVPWNQCLIDATDQYKKCIEKNRDFEPAYVSTGVIAMSKNPPDYGLAATSFEKALKINPRSREGLFNMLAVAYLKNDQKTVETYRTRIMEAFPGDRDAAERLRAYVTKKRLGTE